MPRRYLCLIVIVHVEAFPVVFFDQKMGALYTEHSLFPLKMEKKEEKARIRKKKYQKNRKRGSTSVKVLLLNAG